MKAAILMESNKPLVVANIELPQDLLHGQVLVKVVYSGICGAQINEIEAAKGPDKFLPHLLGHEGSGMVLDVGPNLAQTPISTYGIRTNIAATVIGDEGATAAGVDTDVAGVATMGGTPI